MQQVIKLLLALSSLMFLSCETPPYIFPLYSNNMEPNYIYESKIEFQNYEVFVYRDENLYSNFSDVCSFFLFEDRATHEKIGLESLYLEFYNYYRWNPDLKYINDLLDPNSNVSNLKIGMNILKLQYMFQGKLNGLKEDEIIIVLEKMFAYKVEYLGSNLKPLNIPFNVKKMTSEELPSYLDKYFPLIRKNVKKKNVLFYKYLNDRYLYFEVREKSKDILFFFIPVSESEISPPTTPHSAR